jgi:hypothetical protein
MLISTRLIIFSQLAAFKDFMNPNLNVSNLKNVLYWVHIFRYNLFYPSCRKNFRMTVSSLFVVVMLGCELKTLCLVLLSVCKCNTCLFMFYREGEKGGGGYVESLLLFVYIDDCLVHPLSVKSWARLAQYYVNDLTNLSITLCRCVSLFI